MANTAATSPGTMADDATVGTIAWGTPNEAKVSDNVYATNGAGNTNGWENSIKLVKGGTFQGDDKSTGAVLPSTEAYVSYGGATILWGLSWTAGDINASNFGVGYSTWGLEGGEIPTYSHYLKATNFGFLIPTGSTINGILVEIEEVKTAQQSRVDHIRITIYYTEAAAAKPRSQVVII